ncbi:histidinol-phosphate aminotransferase [Heliomicrobium modesticaldum Ice1]|uniref:Histidinol-phosphate aminotransferase n=1 Tax=Heliobacterium modesticaldum (strain ATCC 51547 / Ice1) TaxID=498761 RepID=B0TDN1_HELMI|nr:histidinol-phosphate transaminase [Heliomicrobium modesticaldum]ABZ85556.1 histidinol-phosphate aminotransferase [Heliomicrobium modesticaldum Ice1]
MNDPLRWVRQDIRHIVPYQAKVYPEGVKVDANENPFPWPASYVEKLQKDLAAYPFSRYPDGEAKDLRQALSAYTGRDPAEILISNGSDEAIQLILLTFGGPGLATVISNPTFVMYAMATRYMGGQVIDVPLLEEAGTFRLDVEGLLSAASREESRVIIICNPNNPTGNSFAEEDIVAVLRGTDKIVIVDEAYYEFYGKSMVGRIGEFPNLIVMRTFSKAFALAGLRVGYTMASRAIINEIHKVRQPFNVNAFSQRSAAIALEERAAFENQVKTILAERETLLPQLKRFDWDVFPTDANYVFLRLRGESPAARAALAASIHKALMDRGVLIRKLGGGPSLDGTLRITVGQPEENRRLIVALEKMSEAAEGSAVGSQAVSGGLAASVASLPALAASAVSSESAGSAASLGSATPVRRWRV